MALPQGNNALSSSATSAFAALAQFCSGLTVTNTGASAAWIRPWGEDENPAVITTSTSGAYKLMPGATVTFNWNPRTERGHGYRAFSHICDTDTSTTLKWFAK